MLAYHSKITHVAPLSPVKTIKSQSTFSSPDLFCQAFEALEHPIDSMLQQDGQDYLLNDIQRQVAKSIEKEYQEEDAHNEHSDNWCRAHKEVFAYICTLCDEKLCQLCFSSTSNHKGHRLRRCEMGAEDFHMKCNELFNKIKRKKNQTQMSCVSTVKRIQSLQTESGIICQKIERKISHRPFPNCLLKDEANKFSRELLKSKNDRYQQLLALLKQTRAQELVCRSGKQIEGLIRSEIDGLINYQDVSESGSLKQQSYIHPAFQSKVFTLREFVSQLQANQIISNSFKLFYSEWRVKIYPQGCTSRNEKPNNPYLSIFLQRMDNGPVVKFCVKVELLQQYQRVKHRVVFSKQFSSQFSQHESWGYEKYIRVKNLLKSKLLKESKDIIIRISVSPASYYQASQQLSPVIQQKSQRRARNQQIIESLKRQLNQTVSESEYVINDNELKLSKSISTQFTAQYHQQWDNNRSIQHSIPFNSLTHSTEIASSRPDMTNELLSSQQIVSDHISEHKYRHISFNQNKHWEKPHNQFHYYNDLHAYQLAKSTSFTH